MKSQPPVENKSPYFFVDASLGCSSIVMSTFPTETAMNLIPEFRGNAAELDAFLYAADQTKLKGNAAANFKRIKADTWNEVKTRLLHEFGDSLKLKTVGQQIETLRQGVNESFPRYKERAELLEGYLNAFEQKTKENLSYSKRMLRSHFITGLRKRSLRSLARLQKSLDFGELLNHLMEEYLNIENEEELERRLDALEQGSRHWRINTFSGDISDEKDYGDRNSKGKAPPPWANAAEAYPPSHFPHHTSGNAVYPSMWGPTAPLACRLIIIRGYRQYPLHT